MLFVLLLTRTLSPLEYGTFGLITSITIYAAVIEPIISIWSLRETARNMPSSKTAVLSGCVFSILGVIVFLVSGYFLTQNTDADFNILMYGSILIPGIFLNRILIAINSGWKPEVVSIAQLFFVITEVISAFILVYVSDFGLLGVIFSVLIAYVVSIIIQLFYAKNKLSYSFDIKFLKNWLKRFWLPLYPTIGNVVVYFDVAIFSMLLGSVIGLAFWTAGIMISSIILTSQVIFRPVYSKLVSGVEINFLNENLRQFFFFVLPLVLLVIVFAKPAMFILNPEYVFAFPIVAILAIQVFLSLIHRYFQEILMGIEKVDLYDSSVTDYVKSHLFLLPSLQIIKNIFYVTILFIIISIIHESSSLLELLTYWAIISVLIQIPFIVYLFILIKKHILISLGFTQIILYLVIGIIFFGLTYVLLDSYLQYENELFSFIINLIPYLILGLGGYFLSTFIIDYRTRSLFLSIINEIKKK